MTSTTYDVQGMTCDHCVRALTEELSQVAGVRSVEVRLADQTATVTGDAEPEMVRAAVADAGYEVTGVRP